MFGNIFGGGGSSAPAQPTHTPAPAAPPAQQQPQTPQQHLPAPGSQPRNADMPAPPQPTTPTAPTGAQNISLADLLARPAAPGTDDSQAYANDFINAIMAQGDGLNNDLSASPTQINQQALYEAYQNIDLTSNMDINGLLDGLQGENGAQLLRQALQQSQVNTIMAITPLVNQLIASAMERTSQHAVTQSDHNLTANAIINEFTSRYAYASSPIVSNMLNGFAKEIAKSVPRGTPTSQIVDQLDRMFRGFSISTRAPDRNEQIPRSAQMDFTNLFRS